MAMTEQQIQLVVAAQNGDVRCFEQLYAIYYEKVYGFARMILRNETDAEDILQETFITAWKKLDTLQTPATFSVWIQIIAKNACNMKLRRKNMAILIDAEQENENYEGVEDEEMLPAAYAEKADLKERLGRIIEGLSDVQRQTVVLYYFNELSIDEIADIMECSPGTVKSRLFLARNAIKAEVVEEERKTGQKFYGIMGIPMLPLGYFIQSHIKSMSIEASAANISLSTIKSSISNPGGAGTPSSGTPSSGTPTAQSVKMGKVKMPGKISLTAKIAIGVIAVVVVAGIVAVLVHPLALFGGSANTPDDITDNGGDIVYDDSNLADAVEALPDAEAFQFICSLLEGYWISEPDHFVGFSSEDDTQSFEYGLLQTEYGFGGEITDAVAAGEYQVTLTVHFPAVPANLMNNGYPEKTETVYLDLSDLIQNRKLHVKIGDDEWRTYTFFGDALEQMIAIPSSEYQSFYENYLSHWVLYNPFSRTYTEDTFADDFAPYMLYSGSILQESVHPDFAGSYLDSGDIPAAYVEQTVSRHFPVTPEQYRAALPKTPGAYEYYDPAQNAYHFPGGYGGPEMTGEVTEVMQQGNCYYITCEWSDAGGNYVFSHTVTVVLGNTNIDFYYRENTVA